MSAIFEAIYKPILRREAYRVLEDIFLGSAPLWDAIGRLYAIFRAVRDIIRPLTRPHRLVLKLLGALTTKNILHTHGRPALVFR